MEIIKIYSEQSGYQDIEAEELLIQDLVDIRFFIHNIYKANEDDPDKVTITELSTGCAVLHAKNREDAEFKLKKIIKAQGKSGFEKVINNFFERIKALENRTPFEKAIDDCGINLTETEKSDLKNSLIKFGIFNETN